YLTMASGGGGTVSPASGWYSSGSGVAISAYASSGYSFSSWIGTGSGSYSGSFSTTVIFLNAPVTEAASFSQVPQSYYYDGNGGQGVPAYGTTAPTCSITYYSAPNCGGNALYTAYSGNTCLNSGNENCQSSGGNCPVSYCYYACGIQPVHCAQPGNPYSCSGGWWGCTYVCSPPPEGCVNT
ncbi:MAG: hypothetical protein KGH66_02730, partial [Candidatus Micrarchaeota archaeon]|nr:hypothetical protein [Candidatus Micrarchaeota archaeon]